MTQPDSELGKKMIDSIRENLLEKIGRDYDLRKWGQASEIRYFKPTLSAVMLIMSLNFSGFPEPEQFQFCPHTTADCQHKQSTPLP